MLAIVLSSIIICIPNLEYLHITFKTSNEHHRSFHFCRAVLSTRSFFYKILKRSLVLVMCTMCVQMKSWAGEALELLETVNCCAFLQRRSIGGC
jgi:uncharacterized membrane protein YkvI